MDTTRKQNGIRFIMCMLLAVTMLCTVFTDETYAASKKPAKVSITSVKSVDHNAVKITWKKAKKAKKYQVYRATSKYGKYKKIKTTTARSYTNKKLTTGKKYYYKVRAINGSKKGTFSKKKAATPTLKKTAGAKASAVNATSLKISWDKVNGAKGYQIYRATSKNGKYKKITTTSAISYTNTGLTTGKTYYYKVRAYKKVGKKTKYGAYSTKFSAYAKAVTTAGSGETSGNSGTTPQPAPVQPEKPTVPVREDCYLDYQGTHIYIGQEFTNDLNSKLNGGNGPISYTAERSKSALYDTNTFIYCYDTVDFDNFLMVYVNGGKIGGWDTNADISGVFEGITIKNKEPKPVGISNWGGEGVNAYGWEEWYATETHDVGDLLISGISDQHTAVTWRTSIEQEEVIAEYCINALRAAQGIYLLKHSSEVYGDETYGTKAYAKTLALSDVQANENAHSADALDDGPLQGTTTSQRRAQIAKKTNYEIATVRENAAGNFNLGDVLIWQWYTSGGHRVPMMCSGDNAITAQGYDNISLMAVAGYTNPKTGNTYWAFHAAGVKSK